MATVKVIVRKEKDKIRVNGNGEVLIFIQYGHDGKSILFSTGVRVKPEFLKWDNKNLDQWHPIKKSLPGFTTKNSNIRKIATEIDGIKDRLINQDIRPGTDAVKKIYEEKNKPREEKKDFFALFEEFIANQGNKTYSTTKGYRTVLNNLKSFEKTTGEKITIEKIDLNLYDKLINYFLKEHVLPGKEEPGKAKRVGMSNASIGRQIKNLKAFLSYLLKRGYKLNCNLRDFKVFNEKPQIVYLTQQELEALYKHDFSGNKKLDKARDLFVLQASTGLRISDLLRLGGEHIQGNIIKMKAHKTLKNVIVPLTPRSEAILRKYSNELPVISEQKINEYIKEACQEAGITSKVEISEFRNGQKLYKKYFKYELVSTHTAVKTFITHCGELGISAKVVSEITGKTVKVILDHYYGTNDKVIELEMQKAFGSPDAPLKVAK